MRALVLGRTDSKPIRPHLSVSKDKWICIDGNNKKGLETIMGDVISLQSRQRLSDYQDTPKSDWVTEQLILAYSDGDDVLERVLDQEDQDWLTLCIAHDLTQISLIERGIIL